MLRLVIVLQAFMANTGEAEADGLCEFKASLVWMESSMSAGVR